MPRKYFLIFLILFSCKAKNNAVIPAEKSLGEKETAIEKTNEDDYIRARNRRIDNLKRILDLGSYYIFFEDIIFIAIEGNAIAVQCFNIINNEPIFKDMTAFPFDGFDGENRFVNDGNYYFQMDAGSFYFNCDSNKNWPGYFSSSGNAPQSEITDEMLKLTYDYQKQYTGTYKYVSYELDNADTEEFNNYQSDGSYILAINEDGYLTMTDSFENKYEIGFKIIDGYADIGGNIPGHGEWEWKVYFSGNHIISHFKYDWYGSSEEGTLYRKGYKLIYEKEE